MAIEGREPPAQRIGQGGWALPAIHQQAAPCGSLDQDGIRRAHVQEGQVQGAIRDSENGRPGQEGGDTQDGQDDRWYQHNAQALIQAHPGKGQCEQDRIEQDDEQQGEFPQHDHAMREVVEELHRPVGVGCERPRQPTGQLTQRKVDQAEQQRQSRKDLHGRLGR